LPCKQENARLVAHWRATNRAWWDERAPYWRSLPPAGSIWRDLTLTDDQLRLLQEEEDEEDETRRPTWKRPSFLNSGPEYLM